MNTRFNFSAKDKELYKNFLNAMDGKIKIGAGLDRLIFGNEKISHKGKLKTKVDKETGVVDIDNILIHNKKYHREFIREEYDSRIDENIHKILGYDNYSEDKFGVGINHHNLKDSDAEIEESIKRKVGHELEMYKIFGEECESENEEFKNGYSINKKILERDIKDLRYSEKSRPKKFIEKIKNFYNKRVLRKKEPIFSEEVVNRFQVLAGIKPIRKEPKRNFAYKFRVFVFKSISLLAWSLHPDAKVEVSVTKPKKPSNLTPEMEFMWNSQELKSNI